MCFLWGIMECTMTPGMISEMSTFRHMAGAGSTVSGGGAALGAWPISATQVSNVNCLVKLEFPLLCYHLSLEFVLCEWLTVQLEHATQTISYGCAICNCIYENIMFVLWYVFRSKSTDCFSGQMLPSCFSSGWFSSCLVTLYIQSTQLNVFESAVSAASTSKKRMFTCTPM